MANYVGSPGIKFMEHIATASPRALGPWPGTEKAIMWMSGGVKEAAWPSERGGTTKCRAVPVPARNRHRPVPVTVTVATGGLTLDPRAG